MRAWLLLIAAFLLLPLACLATANGSWLKRVPQADRVRTNPYAADPNAIAAGRNMFLNNCAKCHGKNAEGKANRPSLKSKRIQTATDGELAWLLKNGEVFKGMPGWGALPEPERWQIISYVRSLNTRATGVQE
ncbi:MAG: c-type cytochrome [Terracidiphilus sp.]